MNLSTFAKGFLGLIGARDGGQGVRNCTDFLQPVADLGPFLGTQSRKFVTQTLSDAGFGNGVDLFTIPQNKVWKVLAGSFGYVTAGAGTITDGYVGFVPPEGTGSNVLIHDPITLAAGRVAIALWPWPDLLLNPGSKFQAFRQGLAATASVTVALYVEEYDA